jgi:hypothetical protein
MRWARLRERMGEKRNVVDFGLLGVRNFCIVRYSKEHDISVLR